MDELGTAPEQVHVHVGAMKTGTSYIQGNLDHSHALLADAGVFYPGRIGAAANDLLGKRRAPRADRSPTPWDDLVQAVRAWDGPRALLSMEFLGTATPEQAGRVVDSLRPAEVAVVITARDLARTVPSAWQQVTKNRRTVSWPAFLVAIRRGGDEEDAVRDHFWRHHDIATIARTWSNAVGADRCTVVTVPRRDSDPAVLWDRFCAAVDLDPGDYPLPESHAWNSSLGFAEAEVMRRLNAELGRELDQPSYRRIVTEFISGDVLRGKLPRTAPPRLPAAVHDWAVERSRETVEALHGLGVRVVGDLDELVPAASGRDESVDGTEAPAADDVARLAIRALAELVKLLAVDGDEQYQPALEAATAARDPRRVERRAARRAARAAAT